MSVPPESRNPLVLVVEDEEKLLEITTIRLEDLGCDVLGAENATKALELYREHGAQVDFVFTDLRMDGMSGFELIAALLELNPEVRIVAVSALIDELDAVRARWGDRVRMMLKPYNTEELQMLLRLESA
ncbi:response regulator [Actomonas aquatica]|uniref:Response regulator n=1 Tax=Actomonas aquatica TaxID=2866162 RepID=A0ABZ1C808_9BACT|nr:response regulator [Opitutus sp. WL0086]WRQ86679.1 response regulator [Opitutus sp. WL0086]